MASETPRFAPLPLLHAHARADNRLCTNTTHAATPTKSMREEGKGERGMGDLVVAEFERKQDPREFVSDKALRALPADVEHAPVVRERTHAGWLQNEKTCAAIMCRHRDVIPGRFIYHGSRTGPCSHTRDPSMPMPRHLASPASIATTLRGFLALCCCVPFSGFLIPPFLYDISFRLRCRLSLLSQDHQHVRVGLLCALPQQCGRVLGAVPMHARPQHNQGKTLGLVLGVVGQHSVPRQRGLVHKVCTLRGRGVGGGVEGRKTDRGGRQRALESSVMWLSFCDDSRSTTV